MVYRNLKIAARSFPSTGAWLQAIPQLERFAAQESVAHDNLPTIIISFINCKLPLFPR